MAASLHPETQLGAVHLTVADLDRSVDFYTRVLGFGVLARDGETATLTTDGATPWVVLTAPTDAQAQPRRATGLYHFAILVPDRAALARSLARLVEQEYPLQGAADHLVSEALYLADPDGNGIEIYRDRPRGEWPVMNGQIQMGTDPLDVHKLYEEALAEGRPWQGLDPATRMGHMHLKVANIPQAEAFYADVLGFDIVVRYGHSASFLSVGGYHHHIGLNTWESQGASPPPPATVGLRTFNVIVPDIAEVAAMTARLAAAGVPFEERNGTLTLRDPSGNGITVFALHG